MANTLSISELHYPDGGQYNGQTLNGKRHGTGHYTGPDGFEHEGRFQEDVYHGWGTERLPGGEVVNGFWENGRPIGEQAVTFADGSMVFYQYENGQRLPDERHLTPVEGAAWLWKKIEQIDRTDSNYKEKLRRYLRFHTRIRVPDGITEIPKKFLSGDWYLKKVTLPATLKVIGEEAFYNCGLDSVDLPEGLEVIESRAFSGCYLTSLTLPDSLTSIGYSAFSCVPSNPEIEVLFPNNITVWPDAFYGGYVTAFGFKSDHPTGVELKKGALFQSGDKAAPYGKLSPESVERMKTLNPEAFSKGGCYVATCVYGSYDCPAVWTLRRYRDRRLAASAFGRGFIRVYYAVSPWAVQHFGHTRLFRRLFRGVLDKWVVRLQLQGYESTPYTDD